MKLIFLDVDGVLNASRRVNPGTKGFELKDWVIPKAVERLNRITDATGAKLVISSTWRIGRTLDELREMFGLVGVKAEIVGQTGNSSTGHRGGEIVDWLKTHIVEAFIIIDDDSDLEPYLDRHVHTDLYRGLTRRKVEEAIAMLGRDKTPNQENRP